MQNFNLKLIVILIGIFNFSSVLSDGDKCSKDSKCLQHLPCCSSEGSCGIGYKFCKSNGCIKEASFKDKSCLPPPPCKSQIITIDEKRIAEQGSYNGNYIDYDFFLNGNYEIRGKELILKMDKPNKGTTFKSTRYINYGKITVVLKTSRGSGVVSAFNIMSDINDEIDFEWMGNKIDQVETNWFYRGSIELSQGRNHKIPDNANSYEDYHSYTIDWNEQRIVWLVDGQIIREVKNDGDRFPSTPSYYEFGMWDAGSLGGGVTEWAGGKTDWKSEDVKRDGYYSMKVKEVQIECYGPSTANDSDFDFLADSTNKTISDISDLSERKKRKIELIPIKVTTSTGYSLTVSLLILSTVTLITLYL